MRRWDGLAERHLEGYAGRGWCPERVQAVRRELGQWGLWLKARPPQLRLEEVDAEQIVRYVQERTRFRAKATVNGVMCILRGHGDWFVQEGISSKTH